MFAIAEKEAARLERLTTDFLVYARPRAAQISRANIRDMLEYIATVARAHAASRGSVIEVLADHDLEGEFDATQIQQALLNLVLNAIDACGDGGYVRLNAEMNGSGTIRIDVIDPAGPIPSETVDRIFEPLFTTKQAGNGLGLAIARNIVRTHEWRPSAQNQPTGTGMLFDRNSRAFFKLDRADWNTRWARY